MNAYKPFSEGVNGVLHVQWNLELKTPLIIRAPHIFAIMQSDPAKKKGRGTKIGIVWDNPERVLQDLKLRKHYSQITDFNYEFAIEKSELIPKYSIPPSSIRGALRNAVIKRLIKFEQRNLFSLPKKENLTLQEIANHVEEIKKVFAQHVNEWNNILQLFGNTFDLIPEQESLFTWAGRLRVCAKLEAPKEPSVDCMGTPVAHQVKNSRAHINVRNPIDRFSMAAKDGGLHYALELSEGSRFRIILHILNPNKNDLQILRLWHEEINNGSLHFGGTTTQGRGRAKIESAHYALYCSPKSEFYENIKKLSKPDLAKNTLFEGIWRGYELTHSELFPKAH